MGTDSDDAQCPQLLCQSWQDQCSTHMAVCSFLGTKGTSLDLPNYVLDSDDYIKGCTRSMLLGREVFLRNESNIRTVRISS